MLMILAGGWSPRPLKNRHGHNRHFVRAYASIQHASARPSGRNPGGGWWAGPYCETAAPACRRRGAGEAAATEWHGVTQPSAEALRGAQRRYQVVLHPIIVLILWSLAALRMERGSLVPGRARARRILNDRLRMQAWRSTKSYKIWPGPGPRGNVATY